MGVSCPPESWESKPLVSVLMLLGMGLDPKKWRKSLNLPGTQKVVVLVKIGVVHTGRDKKESKVSLATCYSPFNVSVSGSGSHLPSC